MLHKKEDYRRWKKEQEIEHKKHISKNGKHWYLGYYFHNDHYCNTGRGKLSKYYKRQTNKAMRKLPLQTNIQHNEYRKLYDYWWSIT